MLGLKTKSSNATINPIETASSAGRQFAGEFGKTAKKQVNGFNDDFIEQLLGITNAEKSTEKKSRKGGEMKAGEFISLNSIAAESGRKPDILAAIDYRNEIVHGGERLSRTESKQLENQIENILGELKRLVDSSSMLKIEFAQVSTQQTPEKAGKYYVHFFEWLLIEIRKIRMQVEDSGAWLSVMKSKKSGQKYGAMAKKHGTSFTLSNERTAATQTG